jgi:hypothetical protein
MPWATSSAKEAIWVILPNRFAACERIADLFAACGVAHPLLRRKRQGAVALPRVGAYDAGVEPELIATEKDTA